jgi:EAL domain-containing protein (putative c-di-GMP-specific phosphodiesterase class I)
MFQQNGFKIFMDDFGNGYSSLNMLKDLPVDTLKIDMGFVQDVERSGRAGVIMKSVVDMADQLGMEIVIEGVENQSQLNFVRSIGCRNIQGYYYSKPLPLEEFRQLYAKGR